MCSTLLVDLCWTECFTTKRMAAGHVTAGRSGTKTSHQHMLYMMTGDTDAFLFFPTLPRSRTLLVVLFHVPSLDVLPLPLCKKSAKSRYQQDSGDVRRGLLSSTLSRPCCQRRWMMSRRVSKPVVAQRDPSHVAHVAPEFAHISMPKALTKMTPRKT